MTAPGSVREVFAAFLRLGLTSFGGPVAHLGYFRDAFVVRRRWLTEEEYADLVSLCQFLPGPASSQVGMAIGLQRAGGGGMLAAWAAFTLPSALALVAFGYAVTQLGDLSGAGWILGLKAAAVAVVAQAVIGMGRALTPDLRRLAIAVAAAGVVLWLPGAQAQVAVIVGSGLLGLLVVREGHRPAVEAAPSGGSVARWVSTAALTAFGALLAVAILAGTGDGVARLFTGFYRAGALVFGGGHVVLPLLESETVGAGLLDHDTFLAGYGAAQAVPGPLFTFAAFLGQTSHDGLPGPVGATVALVAIFLPAALLVAGTLPHWQALRSSARARRALAGVNAGVVGLLAATLYDPVLRDGAPTLPTFALAATALGVLVAGRIPPWIVVVASAALGWLLL
ncbi:chromate efflux transporter [Nocardioides daejeonensis]|uniref:chromate efflux transporter n=1 Tax=Nocardioides daejeonensis TaxID=1046556 RepID=UPI000D741762|nr:chromate efflux transporter [Nocardioides daejeonensis]